MKLLIVFLVFLAITFGAFVFAETASIYGKIFSEDGKPLPGVTITLETEGAKPKSLLSGEDGSYQFQDLPLGIYATTFELQGFRTIRQEDIHVEGGRINLGITLKGKDSKEIIIDGDSAVLIDTRRSGVSYYRSSYEMQLLPFRDPWSSLDETPGVDLGMSEDKRIR